MQLTDRDQIACGSNSVVRCPEPLEKLRGIGRIQCTLFVRWVRIDAPQLLDGRGDVVEENVWVSISSLPCAAMLLSSVQCFNSLHQCFTVLFDDGSFRFGALCIVGSNRYIATTWQKSIHFSPSLSVRFVGRLNRYFHRSSRLSCK